ncbi:hypothetical protein [Acidithiobacillus ferrivorans]|uniref:hypothetical protein n=1 Tax=Acidithiobacillus ferrivorans TaxID=160808 RepID=UPI0011466412|nr:hypothetical protein [Acidithiobacillus ferrivorans]MBN6742189.1 hypothetical protein [Acidithiobacillus sp. MC6.1]
MEIYDVMPFADLKICGSKEEAGLRNNNRREISAIRRRRHEHSSCQLGEMPKFHLSVDLTNASWSLAEKLKLPRVGCFPMPAWRE